MNDCTLAIDQLGQRQAQAVIADKGYDADSIVAHVRRMRATAVIPSRRCRKKQRVHDQQIYKQRIASNAAAADSSNFAAWPLATRSPKPASSPSSLLPAPGSCFSYMSIPPRR
ncbi:MAG: hypothetical protein WA476_03705 [Acidobacteriaceae bacterium]